jgi:hypothetical protein
VWALGILIAATPVVDEVDIVELNHVYSYNAVADAYEERLVQLIFWADERVVAWRMWGKVDRAVPVKQGNIYVTRFFDGNTLREIRSKAYIRTRSNFDPEIEERSKFPASKRRGLFGQPPLLPP